MVSSRQGERRLLSMPSPFQSVRSRRHLLSRVVQAPEPRQARRRAKFGRRDSNRLASRGRGHLSACLRVGREVLVEPEVATPGLAHRHLPSRVAQAPAPRQARLRVKFARRDKHPSASRGRRQVSARLRVGRELLLDHEVAPPGLAASAASLPDLTPRGIHRVRSAALSREAPVQQSRACPRLAGVSVNEASAERCCAKRSWVVQPPTSFRRVRGRTPRTGCACTRARLARSAAPFACAHGAATRREAPSLSHVGD